MKTIPYRGRQYEVPDWARFVATDGNGHVWAYSKTPTPHQPEAMWDVCAEKEQVYPKPDPTPDWRDSLMELPQ